MNLFFIILGVVTAVVIIAVILEFSILSKEETDGGIRASIQSLWATYFGGGDALPDDPSLNRDLPAFDETAPTEDTNDTIAPLDDTTKKP